MNNQKLGTLCVQAGYQPQNGEPRVTPIAQSTTFKYDNGDEVGALFDLKKSGFFYTRLGNPSADAVEKKLAALEGGSAAMCTSSGLAAVTIATFNLCSAGDHVVSTSEIYGGTTNLFAVTLKRLGIECTFVPSSASDDELRAAIRPNTKYVFGETLANPALTVLDLERVAKVAHEAGIPLIVDNTFPTPVLCRPFDFGADIVIHSTTKYLDGHARSLGGALVEKSGFNWANGKFPGFTEPDASYHGVVYARDFPDAPFMTKARVQLMRDIGCAPSPFNMFVLEIGMETLHLRMERHSQNALKVAKFLESHPGVEWVTYPGLESSPEYERAKKYMPAGCSGVISVGIKGGRAAAMKFMNSLKLAAIVVHVADARTGVLHPASTTHRQLSDEQLIAAGVNPEMVRLSIGIEDVDDIIADFDQALK